MHATANVRRAEKKTRPYRSRIIPVRARHPRVVPRNHRKTISPPRLRVLQRRCFTRDPTNEYHARAPFASVFLLCTSRGHLLLVFFFLQSKCRQ